jgi:dinuclear metal center YbgI/SA1388 family protein
MLRVADITDYLESIAPRRWAFDWDPVGLQLGHASAPADRILVALDVNQNSLALAEERESQLLVIHHPLIWKPIAHVREGGHVEGKIARLIRGERSLFGIHTNWDAAPGGISETLAARLGMTDLEPIGSGATVEQVKIVVFAPSEARNALIDAMSAAGAGRIGNYERCAFWTSGTGTFVGNAGSNPVVGRAEQVESVAETRIEMVVDFANLAAVVKALRGAHPYEEPAYDLVSLKPAVPQPLSRIGNINPMTGRELVAWADEKLGTKTWLYGDPDRRIERLAVSGGAAGGEWVAAQAAGADAFLTGEFRHDEGVAGVDQGFVMMASGHRETEHPGMEALALRLRERFPEAEVVVALP